MYIGMRVCCAVCVWLSWVMLVLAGEELNYTAEGKGLQLPGDFSIAGLFPLHNTDAKSSGLPVQRGCEVGNINKHGYHLMQALRFAVEEINNSTGHPPLLPGVTLGYQVYDLCSVPASILATLGLLEQQYRRASSGTGSEGTTGPRQDAVAVIGPDSSKKTITPAALLGAYLVPQISYEASYERLSNKNLYPAFFRTIPSDKNQVTAMLQLLVHFNWTWIALLGSDNAYGLQGMQSLSERAGDHGICVAYQAVLPKLTNNTEETMRTIVSNILMTKVNAVVLFSSKSIVKGFFPYVVERNVTGKVWIGTEDWSTASLVSGIPRIRTIGTILGMAVKDAAISGFEEFERKVEGVSQQHGGPQDLLNECLRSTDVYSLVKQNFPLGKYDMTSSFNVYQSVYAVAHALHKELGCDSGTCRKKRVRPWQLLPWLQQVRFSLGNTSVYFDQNGDPPTGYDIVTWTWRRTGVSLRVVGSFSPDPMELRVDDAKIEWAGPGPSAPVPLSICSPECPAGHLRLQTGQHTCCFDCQACPTATFLNTTAPMSCQPCQPLEWAPPGSERCRQRRVLLLAWDAPLSVALLVMLVFTLALTSGSALVFLLHLDTPVAKSAGGRLCLLMLAALTMAAASALCHFGQPSPLACVLKQPLFVFSFGTCLACVTVRAFQVICIFKLSARLPRVYDTWAKNRGPEWTILLLSAAPLSVSVVRVALRPPAPSRDLLFYPDSVVLECSGTLSAAVFLELAFVSLLSVACFALSYVGKDLPANYNEAKCVTLSLMAYMISWVSFFTVYFVSRGEFTMAVHVFATLYSVQGLLAGYFLPKVYIMVLKPQMNTTAHFQNCIQMYTMNKQ